jgi:hypothetical protein
MIGRNVIGEVQGMAHHYRDRRKECLRLQLNLCLFVDHAKNKCLNFQETLS